MSFYEKEKDGTFTFYAAGDSNFPHYLEKKDFFKCHAEFAPFASQMWISKKYIKPATVVYLIGFNIKSTANAKDIRVLLSRSKDKPREYASIDAAFSVLLYNGFDSAVIKGWDESLADFGISD
jgi:hypothetical protein